MAHFIKKCDTAHSAHPGTQRVAAQGLRHIQKLVGPPTQALVENVLALLRSLYSDVQYEASELLKVQTFICSCFLLCTLFVLPTS